MSNPTIRKLSDSMSYVGKDALNEKYFINKVTLDFHHMLFEQNVANAWIYGRLHLKK